MDLSKNHYRKFLVDEVMRASNATASAAFEQVNIFSKTKEFNDSYEQWLHVRKKLQKKVFRPRSMKEILQGMEF